MTDQSVSITEEQAEAFIKTAHQAAALGLLTCSSGNLSMRVSDHHVLLSCSGTWLGSLTAEGIALCDVQTGACLNDRKPTIESGFHLGILRARPEINIVLHCQSPYATVLACSGPEDYTDRLVNTIEMPAYIGEVGIVDFGLPGSGELAAAVTQCYDGTNTRVAVLKNHGQVSAAATAGEALQNATFFEMNCMIALLSPAPRPLTATQQRQIASLGKG